VTPMESDMELMELRCGNYGDSLLNSPNPRGAWRPSIELRTRKRRLETGGPF
jgi:hypothetical protein